MRTVVWRFTSSTPPSILPLLPNLLDMRSAETDSSQTRPDSTTRSDPRSLNNDQESARRTSCPGHEIPEEPDNCVVERRPRNGGELVSDSADDKTTAPDNDRRVRNMDTLLSAWKHLLTS